MTGLIVSAALAGGVFGFLVGGLVVTVRDVLPLERDLADADRQRRFELDKQQGAHREEVGELQGKLEFYRTLDRVTDAILTGVPLHDEQAAPELQIVDGGAS